MDLYLALFPKSGCRSPHEKGMNEEEEEEKRWRRRRRRRRRREEEGEIVMTDRRE
jgi:hypothetical protein